MRLTESEMTPKENASLGIDADFRAMMFAETKEDRLEGLYRMHEHYASKRDYYQTLMDACVSLIQSTHKSPDDGPK